MKVYAIEEYDDLTECSYVCNGCYLDRDKAEQAAERHTYTDEYGVQYWGRVRELEVVE